MRTRAIETNTRPRQNQDQKYQDQRCQDWDEIKSSCIKTKTRHVKNKDKTKTRSNSGLRLKKKVRALKLRERRYSRRVPDMQEWSDIPSLSRTQALSDLLFIVRLCPFLDKQLRTSFWDLQVGNWKYYYCVKRKEICGKMYCVGLAECDQLWVGKQGIIGETRHRTAVISCVCLSCQ